MACRGTVLLYMLTVVMLTAIILVAEPLYGSMGSINSETSWGTKNTLAFNEQVHFVT